MSNDDQHMSKSKDKWEEKFKSNSNSLIENSWYLKKHTILHNNLKINRKIILLKKTNI